MKVKVPNNSLLMGRDCGPGSKHCIGSCYAVKAFKAYPSVKISWQGNSELLRTKPEEYFGAICNYLTRAQPAMYRIHVSGDFISKAHFGRWVQIAERYPGTSFLAFTKSYRYLPADSNTLPSNFQPVLSLFRSMVGTPEDIPAHLLDSYPLAFAGGRWEYWDTDYWFRARDAIDCTGICSAKECSLCWRGFDVHFPIH